MFQVLTGEDWNQVNRNPENSHFQICFHDSVPLKFKPKKPFYFHCQTIWKHNWQAWGQVPVPVQVPVQVPNPQEPNTKRELEFGLWAVTQILVATTLVTLSHTQSIKEFPSLLGMGFCGPYWLQSSFDYFCPGKSKPLVCLVSILHGKTDGQTADRHSDPCHYYYWSVSDTDCFHSRWCTLRLTPRVGGDTEGVSTHSTLCCSPYAGITLSLMCSLRSPATHWTRQQHSMRLGLFVHL